MEFNRHHLFWNKREFERFRLSTQIREHEKSIHLMPIPLHNNLHANIQPTTAPIAPIARMVLQSILELPTYYTTLNTAKSLHESLDDTDAQYLSDHLGKQIPYLELSAQALKRRYIK